MIANLKRTDRNMPVKYEVWGLILITILYLLTLWFNTPSFVYTLIGSALSFYFFPISLLIGDTQNSKLPLVDILSSLILSLVVILAAISLYITEVLLLDITILIALVSNKILLFHYIKSSSNRIVLNIAASILVIMCAFPF